MHTSGCIGRVGGLAVALGVGAAVATGGIGAARATPEASSAQDSSAGRDSATRAPAAGNPRVSPRPRGPGAVIRSPGPAPEARARTGRPAPVPIARPDNRPPAPKVNRPVAAEPAEPVRPTGLMVLAGPARAEPPSTGAAPMTPITPAATVIAPAPTPAPAPRPVPAAAAGTVQSVPAPLTDLAGPGTPAGITVGWVMLAAARRTSRPLPATAVAAEVSTGQTIGTTTGTMAGATGTDPIGTLLLNRTPSQSGVQTGQSPTGVITGTIAVTDPDSEVFTYTVDTGPTHGSVRIDAAGQFVYTPDPAAAHTGVTDTFTVTVSDAPSGFHIHGLGGLINLLTFGLIGTSGHTDTRTVTVIVDPVNTAPTATVTVGDPDAATGVIVGRVDAADADGDPLSYDGSGATAKGTLAVGDDGGFTYTPTFAARHAAAALDATDAELTDSVVVTVTDGHGGVTPVSVRMTIAPVNTAPAGSVSVDPPDPLTGVVAGTVLGIDADGDALSYGASQPPAKGSVAVGADGGFSYQPTAIARHAAAKLDAVEADTADGFTVTVSDGYGGSVDVPVTVVIAPQNAAPVADPVVGLPDPATGVVAGTVLGIDADGDALSYGTSQAPVRGSVVVGADGGFSYTPTALARHLAAADDAAVTDTTDGFTVTVTDGYGGSVDVPVTVTVSPAGVSFAFAYGTGSQHWTPAARTALESAATTLAAQIIVDAPVTVTYDVRGENSSGSGWLATAFVNFGSASPGYHQTVVQTKILTGADANGATADSRLTVNFAYPWALGDTVTGSRYDFQAVALHELVHTLGFITGFGTDPNSIDRNWTTYDSFLAAADGTSPIGGGYVWDAAYLPNLTGGNGGLFFDGPNAVGAYGAPVPIYTPGTWTPGSSLSHLDPADAPAGTVYLMDPSDGYGPGVRALTPVEAGILTDLGYTIHVLFFVGFGVLRRRR